MLDPCNWNKLKSLWDTSQSTKDAGYGALSRFSFLLPVCSMLCPVPFYAGLSDYYHDPPRRRFLGGIVNIIDQIPESIVGGYIPSKQQVRMCLDRAQYKCIYSLQFSGPRPRQLTSLLQPAQNATSTKSSCLPSHIIFSNAIYLTLGGKQQATATSPINHIETLQSR